MKMKNEDIVKIGIVVILVFGLLWVFRGLIFEEESPETDEERRGVDEEIPAAEAFGDLAVENLEGESSSIGEQEGKPVLITFWEEDHEESQQQLTILNNLQLLLGDEVAFLSVYEPEDRSVPYTAVIDREGLIFREYEEVVTEEDLLSDIEVLLEREE